MKKEEKNIEQETTEALSKANVSSSADLKVGDKIDIGGFVTELKEIKYDTYAEMELYWFYNENGEYKYNVREWITKV